MIERNETGSPSEASADAGEAPGAGAEIDARRRLFAARPEPVDRVDDGAVLLDDPGLIADPPSRVIRRESDAERERSRGQQTKSEPVPDPHEQMLRRQLDEFRSEHAGHVKEHDGLAYVGSVVAAAAGSAIVYVGRNEYVSVALPADSPMPLVGTTVNVDRAGHVASSDVADRAREGLSRERAP